MNLPNQLSFFRLFLSFVILFLFPVQGVVIKVAVFSIFTLASLTDYWDGRIARRTGQITSLGRFLDPVADKTLTFSALFGFLRLGLIAPWMLALIVFRDLLVTGLRLAMPQESKSIEAQNSGKHKTVIQFTAIILILLYLIARETVFWRASWTPLSLKIIDVGMFFVVMSTLYSGAIYIYSNRNNFTGRKS